MILFRFQRFSSILILIVLPILIFSQSRYECGVEDTYHISEKENPIQPYKRSPVDELKSELQKKYISSDDKCLLNIPIVIHVIHFPDDSLIEDGTSNPTDDYLMGIIDNLTQSFNGFSDATGCNINFCPALYNDTNQSISSPGINRLSLEEEDLIFYLGNTGILLETFENEIMPNNIWDTHKYLNIWLVPSLFTTNLVGNIVGSKPPHAYYPQAAQLEGIDTGDNPTTTSYISSPSNDGAVLWTGINNNNPSSVPHEIGHWLGALHTHGTAFDNANGYCISDDYCSDTGLSDLTRSCEDEVSCGESDPVNNIMSYSPDECRTEFTPCQYQRFHTALTNDFMRYSITQNSHLCSEATWNTAVAEPSFDVLCIGDEFQWSDYIDVFVPTGTMVQYSWSIDNGQSWTPFQTNPTLIAGSNVSYLVQVATINFDGSLTILNKVEFDIWVILDCNWPPNNPNPDTPKETKYISIAPNPASNIVSIKSKFEVEYVILFDLMNKRQQVFKSDFEQIDISTFSDGLLYAQIKLKGKQSIVTKKVVKTAL